MLWNVGGEGIHLDKMQTHTSPKTVQSARNFQQARFKKHTIPFNTHIKKKKNFKKGVKYIPFKDCSASYKDQNRTISIHIKTIINLYIFKYIQSHYKAT